MRDIAYILMTPVRAPYRDADAIIDMVRIACGGRPVPSHFAEELPSPITVGKTRDVVRFMKAAAAHEGVALRFAKILRGGELAEWAKRNSALINMPLNALLEADISSMTGTSGLK